MREPPIVRLLTIVRHAGEFAAVEISMRGDEVISREILEQSPDSKEAWVAFQEAAARRFLRRPEN